MLIDYLHPEGWSSQDRLAYLRWRLATLADWWRTNEPDRARRRGQAEPIREGVGRRLEEYGHLFRKRHLHCACPTCRRPAVSPWFLKVSAELEAIERGIRERRAP